MLRPAKGLEVGKIALGCSVVLLQLMVDAAKAKGKRGAEEDEGIQDHVSDEETAEYEAEQEAVDRATHHFQFSSFEQVRGFAMHSAMMCAEGVLILQKFATEGVLRTLMSYLSRYKTFAFEYQIKHVVKLLHRQAVKAKAVGLFFKASVLNLFRDILDDRKSLPKTQSWNDLFSLIQYVLKAFFKAAREQPMLLIEVCFSRMVLVLATTR